MRKTSLSAHWLAFKTMPMPFVTVFCVFLICLLSLSPSFSQVSNSPSSDYLFSPLVAHTFYELACQLTDTNTQAAERKIEQAIIFLNAAVSLDPRANYVLPKMVSVISQSSGQDRSRLLFEYLKKYVDSSADLQPTRKAVRYLLDQLNSREEREQLLSMLLQTLGDRNAWLNSELSTLLGLLMAEKTDYQAATELLMRAYNNNKYNKLAFDKVLEINPEKSNEAVNLERLRLELEKNPLNLKSAVDFARYAEQLQLYQTAADAYEYSAQLYNYLYPSQPLVPAIYLPWAISTYNTQRNQHKCQQIAQKIRQSGRFDLFVETIAAKALENTGDSLQAGQLLKAAEQNAIQPGQENSKLSCQQLAWFYCFGLPEPEKALGWANKAYSIEPNSPAAAGLLAYSLVTNGQTKWAKTIIENYQPTQISQIALALVQLEENQKDLAIDTLKTAIAHDPGSLEAQSAKFILAQNGGEYIQPASSATILTAMTSVFGQNLVPQFNTPENIISARLNLQGSRFHYNSEFGASLAITNKSDLPLVVCDDGLFAGNIRLDARLSGDIEKNIPNLVSKNICPCSAIEPDRSLIIPLTVFTGQLRQVLSTHPQASIDIELTVFLDPIVTETGEVTNTLADIKPVKANITRPGIKITTNYLQNRLNSIAKGKQGQKIKTAELFAGLLAEQNAMADQQPLYEFTYADWMPPLLKSALVNNLADDDWIAKIHTMAAMYQLPLDYEFIEAASGNLNETHWPARLMTIAMLAKAKHQGENFKRVLDWTARYDSNLLVRQMAIALGAVDPTATEPANQPTKGN